MSIIAAGTSSGTALVSTGDTNGTLVIQTNGTTVAATFGTDQSLTVVGALTIGSAAQAVPSGSAPLFAARAWVNFNGTGTVAIRASGNVSSITDNGTGTYAVNFTTALPDVDYSIFAACRNITAGSAVSQPLPDVSLTTSSIAFNCFGSSSITLLDVTYGYVSIFR